MIRRLLHPTLFAAACHASLAPLPAKVVCPPLFGDHMVLQCECPVPVWGTAEPGETVTVEFAGQRTTTVADAEGRWRIALEPLASCADPRPLSIRGEDVLAFSDVLVGEVWFCSGQSNMEKSFGPHKGQQPVGDHDVEVAAARFPRLRLFQIPHANVEQQAPGVLEWLPCSPETLLASNFSAAAYFFGEHIHRILDVPVGLIHSSFGGTRIEAWTPAESYAEPPLRDLPDQPYFPWIQGVGRSELFQSMVAPHAPFALRGFIWYQGETNLMAGNVAGYADKQRALITGWRKAWNLPEAPFYGVLLAPMDYSRWVKFPVTASALPAFWEQQVQAFSTPRTGYVVTTDLVSNTHDIHPPNKRDVGLRLARLALAETYGRSEIASRGPTYVSMRIDENRIELTFDHADGLRTRDGLPPTGFTLSDKTHSFQPAQARIEGDKVIVQHDRVTVPVAVRFAWDETSNPNFVNAAGLPMVPFRTDDWPVSYLRHTPETGGQPAE